jgi:RND family efflux transporter MFP subunit
MDVRTHESKSDLLRQLRIRRDTNAAKPTRRKLWWIVTSSVLAAAVASWLLFVRTSPIPLRTITAQALSVASDAAPPASLLDASGYVIARRRATVSSKITGKVIEVRIEEGQAVAAGDIIARLDESNARAAYVQAAAQVAESEAALAAAQTALDDAKPIYERNEKQRAAAVISDQTLDQARAVYDTAKTQLVIAARTVDSAQAGLEVARRNVDDTVVRAPFAGVVTEKSAQPGEVISPVSAGGGYTRTGIGTIVDMNSLEVEVDVSENFINRVAANRPVRIKLNAYPEWDIPGAVIAAIPTADRAKATVKVRIGILQRDPRIIPEMGARVSFLSDAVAEEHNTPRAGVLVPPSAVISDGDTPIVYLVSNLTTERRVVQLGSKTTAGQIILAGVKPGNIVAFGDLSRVRSGMRVKLADHLVQ